MAVEVTQAVSEVVYAGEGPVQVTQIVLEVLCSLDDLNGYVSIVTIAYPEA